MITPWRDGRAKIYGRAERRCRHSGLTGFTPTEREVVTANPMDMWNAARKTVRTSP